MPAAHSSKRRSEVNDQNNKKSVKEKTHDDVAIVRYRSYISDFTQIAGSTWKHLRTQAMAEDYLSKDWYLRLSDDERHLLEALRSAQYYQKDME